MNTYFNTQGLLLVIIIELITVVHSYSFLAEHQKKCASKSDCFACSKEYNCYWKESQCVYNSTRQSTGSRWYEKFSQCKFAEPQIQGEIYQYCTNADKGILPLSAGLSFQAFKENKTEVYCEWTVDSLNPSNEYKFLFYLNNITKFRFNNFVLVFRYPLGTQEKSLMHDYYNKTAGITGFTLYYYGKNLSSTDNSLFVFKVKKVTMFPIVITFISVGAFISLIIFFIILALYKERRELIAKNELELQEMNAYIEKINKLLSPVLYSSIKKNPDQTVCTICIDEFKNEDTITQLECNHLFHYDCIRKWIEVTYQYPKCPNCNKCLIEDIIVTASSPDYHHHRHNQPIEAERINDVAIQVDMNINVNMNMHMNVNMSNLTSIAIL